MSVETVKARLVKIQDGISGVRRAYAHGPASLPPGDLPIFVNFTEAGAFDWLILGSDYNRETRLYLMRLYVRQIGQGIDGEAERLCEPFFASVRDQFAARPGLGLATAAGHLASVQLATLLGDGGVSVMPYAGERFIGIEWRLQVIEYLERGYDDYE